MEAFKERGVFWLPSAPESHLSGELTFAEEDGFSLALTGLLDEVLRWPESIDVIVGVTLGSEVTLFDIISSGPSFSSRGVATLNIRPQKMVVGHLFEERADATFTSADVRFTQLGEWIGRSGTTYEHPRDSGKIELRYELPETDASRFARGSVSTNFSYRQSGDAEEWRLVHYPSLCLDYDEPVDLRQVLRHVADLQGLISLCTDAPVATKELRLFRDDLKIEVDGAVSDFNKPMLYRAPPIISVAKAEKSTVRYEFDLSFEAIGGIQAVARWLDFADRYRPVVQRLTAVRSGRTGYMENRLMNVLAAAESFDRCKYKDGQIPPVEYETLSALIVDAVPDEHREWVAQKLEYMNEPVLRKRLQRLANENQAFIAGMLGDKPRDWASTLTSVRNLLAHLGEDDASGPLSGRVMFWLNESIFSVLRVAVLRECVVDQQALVGLSVAQAEMSGQRIADAFAEARAQLKRTKESRRASVDSDTVV